MKVTFEQTYLEDLYRLGKCTDKKNIGFNLILLKGISNELRL